MELLEVYIASQRAQLDGLGDTCELRPLGLELGLPLRCEVALLAMVTKSFSGNQEAEV